MYLTVALLILIAKVQQIFLILQRNMEKDTYFYKKIKITDLSSLKRILLEILISPSPLG